MIPVLGRAEAEGDEFDPLAGSEGRVLILEEASPVIRSLRDALARCGVANEDIVHAATLNEALDLFDQARPRLVFAEFLGDHAEDGLEVIHEMLERAPECKVVLVTAEARDAPEVRAAVRAGVFAVIEKPLRYDKVRMIFQDLVNEEGSIERFR